MARSALIDRCTKMLERHAKGRMKLKKTMLCLLSLVGAVAAPAQITVKEPIPARATIDVNAARVSADAIPRTIFGTFLEPIGNSTYNGLWAEILENPSFESGMWSSGQVAEMLRREPNLHRAGELGLPLPWEPIDSRQGNRYEVEYGHAANSWQSLRIYGVPGAETGIRQKVYLPVHRTHSYVGSFYARHLDGASELTVGLRPRDGQAVLSEQTINLQGEAWTRYTFKLEVPQGGLNRLDAADFFVRVTGNERVELDQFSLMPADAIDGLDPDAVAMARSMHTPLVRFGGNFTSGYHWRDGIGPRDKRVSTMNLAWGIPEYNTFGTDEFLEFCHLIGAEPQVALNMGTGSPSEAADWVRYVNEHADKHSGLLWELGNELWGNWNTAYPTQGELAERTLAYSKAVHAVDPTARLIATGQDMDGYREWNQTQLANPAGTFDALSTHFVVGTGEVLLHDASNEFVAAADYAMPVELGRRLQQAQKQIDETPGYNGKAHLAFTEWLFIGDSARMPNFTNEGGAVVAASFLNMLMRESKVVPISDMTGIMEFAGIWKKKSQVYATPAYYAFSLYAGADANKTVETKVQAGSYSVAQGVKRLPEISDVPYLDVVAAESKDGKKLTLFCVSRSTGASIPTTIRLHDFAAKEMAQVKQIASEELSAANDETSPLRVTPQGTTIKVTGESVEYNFPKSSITVITLERK